MTDKIKLFSTAFLQVFLVACSTVFIAKNNYPMAFATSFGISWLWAVNVRKIAISTTTERFIYALGAAFGSISGIFMANLIN